MGNRGGSTLINHAANSDLHQMKRMVYKRKMMHTVMKFLTDVYFTSQNAFPEE